MSIYKLQKPISSTESMNTICAYEVNNRGDRSDSPTRFVELTDEEINELFGDYYKVYFDCEIKGGKLEVNLDKPYLKELWV